MNVVGALVAVQLDKVQTVFLYLLFNIVNSGIDKHSDTLAFRWQIAGTLADVATGLWPEDEAHQVDGQTVDRTDVLRITHATYFYNGAHRANGLTG